MAEPMSTSAITPTPAAQPQPTVKPVENFMGVEVRPPEPEGGYTITIRRFNASGDAKPLVVHIPQGATPEQIRSNPMLLAAVLKDGDPVWSQMEPGFVLVAALKAAGLGLDLLEGDIYPVEGRLGISDWAKIKYARSKGYRAIVRTTVGPQVNWDWKTAKQQGIWTGTNDTIAVDVLNLHGEIVNTYETSLKAWWEGRSNEWRQRPSESLRRKAIARAYQEVCPVGIDPEEAPPLQPSLSIAGTDLSEQLSQSVIKAKQGQQGQGGLIAK
jgi:hypothetical protein